MRFSFFKSSLFKLPDTRKFEYVQRTEPPPTLHTKTGNESEGLQRGFIRDAASPNVNSSSSTYRIIIIILIMVVPSSLYIFDESMLAIISLIPLCWMLFRSIKSGNG